MDQQAYQRLVTMLNDFPSGTEDKDLRLRSFEDVLSDIPASIIADTARRYSAGEVAGQSMDYAPTPARFREEAKRLHDVRSYRPRLAAPVSRPDYGGLSPFELRQQKSRAENAHFPIIAENVSFDQFKLMSRNGEVPVGGKWIAATATVYGPAQQQAAE